jgi:cytochrome P450 family 2 subfamily U polypeptide 1
MFLAGYSTTSATLLWGLLYLITYPEIQQKVQDELDEVIGRDRIPSISDRHRLPYTDATINEIHRVATVVPVGMPHSNNSNDVKLRGYTIPKTTPVFANIWAVHRDPKIWKSPDRFDPGNFLDDDGEFVNKKELMPFSIGR